MQFGYVMPHILQHLADANPKFGPVKLMKIDLADGYYHIPVSSTDVQQLGVIMPTNPGHEPLIAFPLMLPMGWNKSPPYFCAFMEMVVEVCIQQIRMKQLEPKYV